MASFYIFLSSLFFLGTFEVHAANRCEQALLKATGNNLSLDLLDQRENEAQNLSPNDVAKWNQRVVQRLEQTIPKIHIAKSRSVSYRSAERLLEIVRHHEVVGPDLGYQYRRNEVEIGYCFGRATFVHLMLLKMGLQKSSIRKVWAVGPMATPLNDVVWAFHVATAVYTHEKGWLVLDTLHSRPVRVAEWFQDLSDRSLDQKPRFYVTAPQKFGVNTGAYDRIELGLDLPRNLDWYQHYFVDLLRSVREANLSKLGL